MNADRLIARLTYYPTLGFSRLLCALGVWRRWHWVDDSLALGVRPSRRDLRKLHEAGVRSIVNLCEEFPGDLHAQQELGIQQLYLPTLDYQHPALADVRRAVDFIRDRCAAGEKVYVHCKAGQGRSGTVALCYLIATRGLSPAEAQAKLQSLRPEVNRGLDLRPVVRAFADGLAAAPET